MSLDDGYVDLKGLARYSALSVSTLQRRARDRVHPLPAHRVGKRLLFRKPEFDIWLREHQARVRAAEERGRPLVLARR